MTQNARVLWENKKKMMAKEMRGNNHDHCHHHRHGNEDDNEEDRGGDVGVKDVPTAAFFFLDFRLPHNSSKLIKPPYSFQSWIHSIGSRQRQQQALKALLDFIHEVRLTYFM